MRSCAICGALVDASRVHARGLDLCGLCVERIEQLLLSGSQSELASVWRYPGGGTVRRRAAIPQVYRDLGDSGGEVLKQKMAAEAETHLDLADAYLEMSLLGDALHEIGVGLGLAADSTLRARAISLAFDSRLIRDHFVDHLRELWRLPKT